jgi:hypothetical protein
LGGPEKEAAFAATIDNGQGRNGSLGANPPTDGADRVMPAHDRVHLGAPLVVGKLVCVAIGREA